MEKQIKSEKIFDGKVVKLYKDEVELDDKTKSVREIVKHSGGACIALKSKNNKYYMVKQYRYALGIEMYEFCAGKLELNEDPDLAIIREAKEEIGVSIKDLKSYGYMIPTCGYSSEKIYLYSATEDKYLGQDLDIDERLDVYEFSLEEIEKMIKKGEVVDAKTICLVYYLKNYES